MDIALTIDGQKIKAKQGQTVLDVALSSGIYIPHLCHHPDLPSFREVAPLDECYRGQEKCLPDGQGKNYQGCGLCLVDIKNKGEPVLSCVAQVEEGMEVIIQSNELDALRQQNLVALLAHHPHACLICAQKEGCSLTQCSTNVPEGERCCPQFDFCELRKVAEYIGLREDMPHYIPRHLYTEEDKPLFIRDYNLCVSCLRCVRVCGEIIGAKALGYVLIDNEVVVGTTHPSLEESGCCYCGACVEVCPTGALRDKELKAGSLDERLQSFDPIHPDYEEDGAQKEANRCLKCDLRFRLSSTILPPEIWLEFTSEAVNQVPDSEGAFQLLDEEKLIIYIAGTPNLRQSLQEQLTSRPEARYFNYEEDPMYTKKESELIQQFLQRHGHLPPGNEEIEDLF